MTTTTAIDIYDQQCDLVYCFLRRSMTREILESPNCHILELGCGNGMFGRRLLLSYPNLRITGVDQLDGPLQCLSSSLANMDPVVSKRYTVLKADINNPYCLGSQKFDLILCANVLHHIPNLHRSCVPNNISKWLRRGGYLLIFDPNGANPVLYVSNKIMRILVRFYKRLQVYKWIGETMYTPAYYANIFTQIGFLEMCCKTHVQYMEISHKSKLVSIRNILNNLVSHFCFGSFKGVVQTSLFCNNAKKIE